MFDAAHPLLALTDTASTPASIRGHRPTLRARPVDQAAARRAAPSRTYRAIAGHVSSSDANSVGVRTYTLESVVAVTEAVRGLRVNSAISPMTAAGAEQDRHVVALDLELAVDHDEALAAEAVLLHDLLTGGDGDRGREPIEGLEFGDGDSGAEFAGEEFGVDVDLGGGEHVGVLLSVGDDAEGRYLVVTASTHERASCIPICDADHYR